MLKTLKKVTYGSTNTRPLLPEETEPPTKQQGKLVRRRSVPKLALHYTVVSGKAVLEVLDTMGEWLAEFFLISPPLNWYLAEELEQQRLEELERKRAEEVEGKIVEEVEGKRPGQNEMETGFQENEKEEKECLSDNEEDIILDTGKIG